MHTTKTQKRLHKH